MVLLIQQVVLILILRAYLKHKYSHMLNNIAHTGDGTYKRTMVPVRAFN